MTRRKRGTGRVGSVSVEVGYRFRVVKEIIDVCAVCRIVREVIGRSAWNVARRIVGVNPGVVVGLDVRKPRHRMIQGVVIQDGLSSDVRRGVEADNHIVALAAAGVTLNQKTMAVGAKVTQFGVSFVQVVPGGP